MKNYRILFFAALLLISISSVSESVKSAADPLKNLKLITDFELFSPNDDGYQDTIQFQLYSKIPGIVVKDWFLEIEDSSNRPVRRYSADLRKMRDERKFSNYFMPEASDFRPVYLFRELQWDGLDDRGKPVNEGTYTATVKIITNNNHSKIIHGKPFYVDTTEVDMKLVEDRTLFLRPISSNGLHIKPVKITQIADEQEGIVFKGSVRNIDGEAVFQKVWKNKLPHSFLWDGMDSDGDPVAYGVYSYELSAVDRAGNHSKIVFRDIIVSSTDLALDLRSDLWTFSPDGNNIKDRLSFYVVPFPEKTNYYEDWNNRLNVIEWDFTIFKADRVSKVYQLRRKGHFPEHMIWDGKNNQGKTASEGIYYAMVTLHTSYGQIQTSYRPVRLDVSVPAVDLYISDNEFTPDGDGRDEEIAFFIKSEDNSKIDNWKLKIVYDPPVPFFIEKEERLFHGKNLPEKPVVWNGNNSLGEKPYSLERYSVIIEVTDRAGNTSRTNTGSIETGVLFLNSKDNRENLIVRISDRKYFNADKSLSTDGKRAIQKFLSKYMRNYSTYLMDVESCTSRNGEVEENLLRTEDEARNIEKLLENSGVHPQFINARGVGEAEPVMNGNDEFSDYKNRRIQVNLKQP